MRITQTQAKLERRNLILSTMHDINRMFVRERDRTRLLERICHKLVENRGYNNAWIALLDDVQVPIEVGYKDGIA